MIVGGEETCGGINKFKKRGGGKTQVRAEERKKRREKKRDETSQRCSVASLAAPAHYTYACTMSAEATTMTMRHIARHLCAVAGAQEATNWMLGNEKFREPASRKKRIFRGTAAGLLISTDLQRKRVQETIHPRSLRWQARRALAASPQSAKFKRFLSHVIKMAVDAMMVFQTGEESWVNHGLLSGLPCEYSCSWPTSEREHMRILRTLRKHRRRQRCQSSKIMRRWGGLKNERRKPNGILRTRENWGRCAGAIQRTSW